MTTVTLSPVWIRAQLKERRVKQADLVKYLNDSGAETDETKISKSLNNQRNFKHLELYFISRFLDLTDEEYFGAMRNLMLHGFIEATPDQIERIKTEAARHAVQRSAPMPNAGLPERIDRTALGTLPILGQSLGGGPNSRTQFNGQKLGEVEAPRRLAEVPEAYATFVHGTSMEPRYEAGEVVLVNPQKPIRRDCYVVAQVYDNQQDPPFGYIKRFISFSDTELVLEQLNPPAGEDAIMRFPRERVVSVHRIVGTLDE